VWAIFLYWVAEKSLIIKSKISFVIIKHMNQKGFINVLLIVLAVIFTGAIGYFMLTRNQEPTPPTITQLSVTAQRPKPQPSIPTSVPNESPIEFLSPIDDEQIKMDNGTYTIRWVTNRSQNGDKKVYLYAVHGILDPPASLMHFIGATDFNSGTYKWILPNDTNSSFGANFIDTNEPIKLAMALYPSDMLPPNPLTWMRDLQTKPNIIYSGTISFKPITVNAKFTFPVGGERFTLGNPLVIKWELPTDIEISDVNLFIDPIDNTKNINGNVHTEYSLPSQIRSYTWNSKFMHIPVGPSFSSVKVEPGMYYLHLGFRTTDGYYQGVDSRQFELINP
jgi:hypothetical protein